jgi:ribonuclease HI
MLVPDAGMIPDAELRRASFTAETPEPPARVTPPAPVGSAAGRTWVADTLFD